MAQIDISLLTPNKVLFKGKAGTIIMPGEQGVFEVLAFHKPILSRLISGILYIDDLKFSIKRGIVKVKHNQVTVVAETE